MPSRKTKKKPDKEKTRTKRTIIVVPLRKKSRPPRAHVNPLERSEVDRRRDEKKPKPKEKASLGNDQSHIPHPDFKTNISVQPSFSISNVGRTVAYPPPTMADEREQVSAIYRALPVYPRDNRNAQYDTLKYVIEAAREIEKRPYLTRTEAEDLSEKLTSQFENRAASIDVDIMQKIVPAVDRQLRAIKDAIIPTERNAPPQPQPQPKTSGSRKPTAAPSSPNPVRRNAPNASAASLNRTLADEIRMANQSKFHDVMSFLADKAPELRPAEFGLLQSASAFIQGNPVSGFKQAGAINRRFESLSQMADRLGYSSAPIDYEGVD